MNSPSSPIASTYEYVAAIPPPRESLLGRYRIPFSWGIICFLLIKELLTSGHPFERIDQSAPIVLLGVSLILFGTLLRTWANGILHKNQTLTTAGPYQLVRHPLYAGTLLMMLGVCFLFVDIFIAAGLMLLIVTSYGQSIRYEEQKLARRFGPLWTDYSRRVPSLIPRFQVVRLCFRDWHFDRWKKNREHKTLFATLAILISLEAYQMIR